jgi:hypothetical protein
MTSLIGFGYKFRKTGMALTFNKAKDNYEANKEVFKRLSRYSKCNKLDYTPGNVIPIWERRLLEVMNS